jgi:hypothetical protein
MSRVTESLIAVEKFALHFPVAEIKPTLRSATETFPISAPPTRKRPAQFRMPTAEYPRHKPTNFVR